MSAALSATFESLGTLLRSHRAVTRVSLTTLSLLFLVALSQQATPVTKAGPEVAPLVPESLLPKSIGVGIASDEPVSVEFDAPVNRAVVEESLQILPGHKIELSWNPSSTVLTLSPEHLWRTDERYLIVVPARAMQVAAEPNLRPMRFAFTTQTAPVVTDFQVRLANAAGADTAESSPEPEAATLAVDPVRHQDDGGSTSPSTTAEAVSATSAITIGFSTAMDRADTEDHFLIQPEATGDLAWKDGKLVFTPDERLEPGGRYTISLIGAHDAAGNVLGGEANFSFIVQDGAQLVKTAPKSGASDVEPATVEMWFSGPMDVEATNAAFALKDTSTGALVGGLLNWNEAGTQLTYTPDNPFTGGRTFEVSLGEGARDVDGNGVTTSWRFTTKAAPVAAAPASASSTTTTPTTTRSAPSVPAPAPATSLAGYALNQVNAARAAYGFAPLVLDANVSAAAAAHAWDQANNGYFSHTSLDGRTRDDRLRAAGVSFGKTGENQCYHIGMSQQATLDWCHAQFMAEPYPGHWNHIANILHPEFRRMGVGIATVGGRTVITWNFTD